MRGRDDQRDRAGCHCVQHSFLLYISCNGKQFHASQIRRIAVLWRCLATPPFSYFAAYSGAPSHRPIPRLWTTPIFKEGLQQRFATGEMGCTDTESTVIPLAFRLASKAFAKFVVIVSSLALFV